MITSFSSGKSSISRGAIMIPSGISASPSERAMFWYFFIERPTSATLRPRIAAASITCCTRCTFDAKLVTITRPGARSMTSVSRGPTIASLIDQPGRSAFVESPQSRSRPSSPSRARRPKSGPSELTGVWSNL
jgi:hypothetical protein